MVKIIQEAIRNGDKKLSVLHSLSFKLTKWVGTPYSVIFHSFLFVGIPALGLLGFDLRTVLLIFTTWLSIEAIYLAIFIQMTVNRNTESLEEVEEDIEDIQEDVDEGEKAAKVLIHIGQQMRTIQHELDILKKSGLLKSTNGHTIPPKAQS